MLHSVSHISAIGSRLRGALGSVFFWRQLSAEATRRPLDHRYVLTPIGAFLRKALGLAPPRWREAAAERWLRRTGAPGPAAEHVFQYLLSWEQGGDEAMVARGADNFYERQYRQYFNATMGVFAMTAELALLGCGGAARGLLRSRRVCAAMVEELDGAPPILVLDHQSAAVPLLLPAPSGADTTRAIDLWLAGKGPMPQGYSQTVAGDDMRCAAPGARARRRSAVAALIELADGVRETEKLAILALHPRDPDARGLQITLFGVESIAEERLARDHGLDRDFLTAWRRAAANSGRLLRFCVGGTEEVFTQCSQNLFVKRCAPRPRDALRATWPDAWDPGQPLERLIAKQFELFQATVSASGLPGASPRNGDIGKAAFVSRSRAGASVLIPYFAGNAIHGHAAKLWSNPEGAIVVWDDHTALCTVVLSGPSHVVAHEWVEKYHPDVAREIAERKKRLGTPAAAPEYWFVQEVAEILQQDEPLPRKTLDPMRPTCSIHAAGHALHGKKPAYFAADALPAYDQALQHERECEGRPVDPSGVARRYWERKAESALAARRTHLLAI